MPIVLRDGNGAFYPLVKHCLDGIRTPAWLTLPPMSCLHVKTRVLSNSMATVKPKISLLAVVFRVSLVQERLRIQSILSLKRMIDQYCVMDCALFCVTVAAALCAHYEM